MTNDATTVRRRVSELRRGSRTRLVVVSSPDPEALGRDFVLGDDELVFGRSVDGRTRIVDRTLSRRHFKVGRSLEDADAWMLQDLGGANGTMVDGRTVARAERLSGHAVIWAGETVFVVEPEPEDDGLAIAHDVDGSKAALFWGDSFYADRIRRALETAATAEGSVLILGPSGSGKEVSAQAIHAASGTSGPFVPVNCAAIPGELAEAELFGHARGAFTGADRARAGHFVEADGGTLFLDEVGELPMALQSKLLRVLETGVVQPVGGRPVQVGVRVVAATNRDVESADIDFRKDLLARLSDWIVRLPPLSQRRTDVLPLFRKFASQAAGCEPVPTTSSCDAALCMYDWPLNVRELEKLARRLARLARPGAPLDVVDLPAALRSPLLQSETERREPMLDPSGPTDVDPNRTVPVVRETAEVPTREELEEALRTASGNIKQLSRSHGWHRMQVYRWMQRYELKPGDYR